MVSDRVLLQKDRGVLSVFYILLFSQVTIDIDTRMVGCLDIFFIVFGSLENSIMAMM